MLPKPSTLIPTPDGGLEVGFCCATCNTFQDHNVKAKYCYTCGAKQDWEPILASPRLRVSQQGTVTLAPNALAFCKSLTHREQQVYLYKLEMELKDANIRLL